MAIAASIDKTKRYVLLEDRDLDPEDQTSFILRQFTATAMAKVQDQTVPIPLEGAENAIMRAGAGMVAAVKYGIGGWENLKDEDGALVIAKIVGGKGSGRHLADPSVDAIRGFIHELYEAVMKFNSIGDDLGNSDTSQSSGQALPSSSPNDAAATSPSAQESGSSVPSAVESQPSQVAPLVQVAEGSA